MKLPSKKIIKQAIQVSLFFSSSHCGFIWFFVGSIGSVMPRTTWAVFAAVVMGSLAFFGLVTWIYRSGL